MKLKENVFGRFFLVFCCTALFFAPTLYGQDWNTFTQPQSAPVSEEAAPDSVPLSAQKPDTVNVTQDSIPLSVKQPDTIYVVVPPSGNIQQTQPYQNSSGRYSRYDRFTIKELQYRQYRAQRMQNTGFNLLISGITIGTASILLMATNSIESEDAGEFTRFFIGYIGIVVATPPLVSLGIVFNRIGASKKRRYNNVLTDRQRQLSFDIYPNKMQLSFHF